MPPRLSIVIPAFNEAVTLQALICKLQRALDGFAYEVIIVDDGSTDGTTRLVKDLNDITAR